MTDDDLPLDRKIARWVRDSGRSIEMDAAQTARDAGARAIQSVPYIDPIEGKSRETDVIAEFNGLGGTNVPVTLVIECKRAPGKHWVTFPYQSGRISSRSVFNHALVAEDDYERADRLQRAWAGGPTIFGPLPFIGSGLNEADLGKNVAERAKDDQGGDLASKALRQVWSATQAHLVDEAMTRLAAREMDAPITRIVVPVIVTGAHLWECRPVRGGEPSVVEVDYLRVRTPTTGNAVLGRV